MKFASFNLYQFLAPGAYWYEKTDYNTYTPEDWEQKKAWISQQIQTMKADVIGFQEVFCPDELRTLCQAQGYEHFLVIDEPRTEAEDNSIYIAPVVALASKVPIKASHPVAVTDDVKQGLPISADFRFSRKPICATLTTEALGDIRVYVAHLKSKRPIEPDMSYPDDTEWETRIRDTMQRLSRGNVASLLQRGVEATLLYHNVSNAIATNPQQAVVVLGDLNDDQHSIPLSAITMQHRIYDIGGIDYDDWPEGAREHIYRYRMIDSFKLAEKMRQRTRPHTHIHRGQGNVLDYILVSNHFNNRNPDAKAEVSRYQVLHDHLDDDGTPNRLQSDHGQVMIELKAVRDETTLPVIPAQGATFQAQIAAQDVLNREDFIQLAGGVFQSHRHYNQWSGSEKYQNFWSFFFDTDHGWVKSIYGLVPVEELHQKERHSIEHIIPRIFLDEYFETNTVPRNVRNGASSNPFNLAPSERSINAKRSNFPFAMRKGKVKRPDNISLHPESFHATGLNADHEWVIPTRNRGDVARAILYMLLTYGIDELYNQHIDVLVHWAKVDPASPWEIAFNEWVYARHGIRNPLIDAPDKALVLLNNKTLMQSLCCGDH